MIALELKIITQEQINLFSISENISKGWSPKATSFFFFIFSSTSLSVNNAD